MLNTAKLFLNATIMIAVAVSLVTGSTSELLAANSPLSKTALEKKKDHGEKKHSEHAAHAEHHEAGHHNHSHHLAIFSGATSNIDAEHTDFTLGAEYEYRLPVWENRIGIGVIGERVFADFSENILAAAALLHVGNGLKFMLAPGVVFAEEHEAAAHGGETALGEETGHGATAKTETVTEFLFRTGVAKDFHAGKFSITPTLCADFINGHVSVVYGLTFGKGF